MKAHPGMGFCAPVGVAMIVAIARPAVADAPVSTAPLPIETIALSGGLPPGGGGLVYGGLGAFSLPRMNNLGEVVFSTQLSMSPPSGTFLTQGVWAATPQSTRLVFLEGSTISSSTGPFVLSTGFSSPNINDAGQVVTTCNSAIIQSGVGPGQVVIKNGDPVPGSSGTALVATGGGFDFNSYPITNNSGQIVARIGVSGVPADSNLRLLAGSAGALGTRLSSGAKPALGAGVSVVGFGSFQLNGSGAVAGTADVTVNGGNSIRALIQSDAGGPQLIAIQGGQIAGQAAGATFSDLPAAVGFNDQGKIAIAAHAGGLPGVPEAVFLATAGSFAPVAVRGQNAPGLGGLKFGGSAFSAFSTPALNASGQIAFQANLATGSGQDSGWGMFAGDPITANTVIHSGGDAGFGQTFADNSLAKFLTLNDLGEVALLAPIGANQSALFATDMLGTLHRIIAQGDMLQVAPGMFKQISLLRIQSLTNVTGLADPRVFNDLDQVAFFARFTDNTEGIFRATVPAPSGALIIGGVGALAYRRRRGGAGRGTPTPNLPARS